MMRTLMLLLPLLAACTEPTWYPGLPTGVSASPADSGAVDTDTDADTDTDGGTDGGTDTDGGVDSGEPELPCSTDAGGDAVLTVDIQADLGVILWWRAQDCQEYSYGAVPPYVPRDQPTYIGHVWVLRDAIGAYVDHRTVTQASETWEVTE
ncbi:MAG: hypothetical protein H6742_15020 [Alphaproteobacteria bacterium]|nr:hypothetical protein [Alphaproteobacteria bacterium]